MSDEQSVNTDPVKDGAGSKNMAGYAWVAALAAIIGFAAVYVTFSPSDNRSSQKSRSDMAVSPAVKTARKSSTNMVGTRLNSGQMATFVFNKSKPSVPEVVFTDGNGRKRTLKDWQGKVVLLNLWATWCAPCRREMPDLDKLQGALGSKDFEVVAVSVDRKGLAAAKRFLQQIKVKNLGLYNDATARMAAKLKVLGMPTTLLLDRQGREIGRLVGPAEWNSEDARRLIKAHF